MTCFMYANCDSCTRGLPFWESMITKKFKPDYEALLCQTEGALAMKRNKSGSFCVDEM